MSRSSALILIVLAVIIAFTGYTIFSLEWEKKEIEIGLSDEALEDPLLGAKLFLKSKDVAFSTLENEDEFLIHKKITLAKDSTLIIDEAALAEYHHIESALEKWIKSGGHVVYLVSPKRDSLSITDNRLLDQTGVAIEETEEQAYRLSIISKPAANIEYEEYEGKFLTWYLPYAFQFSGCEDESFAVKEKGNVIICEQSLGDGYVTFITSIQPLTNNSLKHLDHGELLLWLVGTNNYLWYLPSLHSPHWLLLLWQWSQLFVMSFLLLMLMTMWRLAIRFGPAKTPLRSDKNIFSEHIEAVGNFLFKHNHHGYLKQALIKDLEHVMEIRNPRFKQLDIAEQVELLSQLSGMNKEAVQRLLTQDLPEDDVERFHYIKLFKQLRNAL